LTILKRGAELSPEDPGVHYQLFLIYSRVKQKADADSELALFKKLDEARKANQGGMTGNTSNEPSTVPDSLRPSQTLKKDKP